MKTSSTIKFLSVALVAAASLFMTGCAKTGLEADLLGPPAYSSGENFHRELRYAAFDQQQVIDDFDRDITMTRPASTLTKWHVRASD